MSDFDEGEEGSFDELDFNASANGELSEKDLVSSGGSKTVNRDGKYHCIVLGKKIQKPERVEGADKPSMPNVQISFQVVGGDHEDQFERAIYHRLYLWKWSDEQGRYVMKSGKELKFQLQIAAAIGCGSLVGDVINFNFNGVEGRQAIVEIRNEPYDENKGKAGTQKSMKDSFRIPFGNVWKPDDPSQVDVPKNAEYMAIYLAGSNDEPPDLFGEPVAA